MIVSVSRRTDIPACYADWFFRRLEEGFVLVRHPMNPHRISRVRLTPDVVDGFVFWTKNPVPMLDRLSRLKDHAYYFQFTLNSYGRDVERNVPSKRDVLVPAFVELSRRIGRERIIWRYDPVFLSEKYTVDYHVRWFEVLAARLAPCTETCVISFLDRYRDTARNMAPLGLRDVPPQTRDLLAPKLAEIARAFGIRMESCAESADLERFGIGHARCVDAGRLGRMRGAALNVGKDGNQRAACGCAQSIDIGAYGSCAHGCRYCYAHAGRALERPGGVRHDSSSPLLLGQVGEGDIITERPMRSCIDRRLVLA